MLAEQGERHVQLWPGIQTAVGGCRAGLSSATAATTEAAGATVASRSRLPRTAHDSMTSLHTVPIGGYTYTRSSPQPSALLQPCLRPSERVAARSVPLKPPPGAAGGGFEGTERAGTRSDGLKQGRNSADRCGEDRTSHKTARSVGAERTEPPPAAPPPQRMD